MIGTHADISDRKRAEEAVQRSEARLRAAFSQTYSFVVLLQPDGTIIEANRAALDAAGVNNPNQLTGRKFWEPWWSPLPQEVAILNDAIRRAATGEMVRGECEFCLPDGTRRICDRTLSPVLDDKGKVTMIVATGLDVTERKQTEAATGLLASIVANSDDAIISKTLDGIVTSWNKGAEAMFGYSSSEAVGRSITLIVPPDRHEEEIDILGRLGRGERIVHFETIRRRRNNSLIELSLTISPIRDSLGKIVGASTIARDISARKHAERMIGRGARQQKALFRLADELLRAGSLEDVYSAALNALLDALQCNRASILLCDAAGIMRFQSWRGLSDEYRAAVEGHTAWRKDDPNPQPVCINNVDAADISEPLKATVKKEGIAALAFIPLLSNGCLIGKFMTYFNMPNDFSHDQIELSVTIARQLAYAIERKRNDEALRESEARLRKLSETLDAEVSRQTEQLRTLSYDLLRTQDEERRHIARELHDSAGQLLTVLGMNLAQLEDEAARRAPRLSKKLEEAENLVQQLHRELRTTSYLLHPPLLDESGLSSALNWYAQGLTERSGIVIDVQAPENGPRLPGDMELAIFRLVQESLTNIHRHSGSKLASIRLTFLETAVEVEIRDQGKGITSDRLAEIQSGRAGVGIRGMQERMRRFEGKLSLASDESGTRVLAQIPMPHASRSNNAAAIHAVVG
jgi:PAS domain S-box-containing protein